MFKARLKKHPGKIADFINKIGSQTDFNLQAEVNLCVILHPKRFSVSQIYGNLSSPQYPVLITMMTEAEYLQYTLDFNAACAGDGTAFGDFYDKYYEPDAVFEYIPNAAINKGRDFTVSFWQSVHELMQEEIQPHHTLVISGNQIAVEAPIDFLCKKDLEWVGEPHKAGTSFRLMMAGFYNFSDTGKIEYVHVYSIYHPHYQVK